MLAALPISLAISVVKFTLGFEVKSLIGHRTKVKDLPKVTELIAMKLRASFAQAFVAPNRKIIPLPELWPHHTSGSSETNETNTTTDASKAVSVTASKKPGTASQDTSTNDDAVATVYAGSTFAPEPTSSTPPPLPTATMASASRRAAAYHRPRKGSTYAGDLAGRYAASAFAQALPMQTTELETRSLPGSVHARHRSSSTSHATPMLAGEETFTAARTASPLRSPAFPFPAGPVALFSTSIEDRSSVHSSTRRSHRLSATQQQLS
jgi:hypothetical protein